MALYIGNHGDGAIFDYEIYVYPSTKKGEWRIKIEDITFDDEFAKESTDAIVYVGADKIVLPSSIYEQIK